MFLINEIYAKHVSWNYQHLMWFWLYFQIKWNNWSWWRSNLCSFLLFLSLWFDHLFYYVVI